MMRNTVYILIVVIVSLLIGFFIGRSMIETREIVEYKRGPSYSINYRIVEPKSESFLSDSKFSDISIPENSKFSDNMNEDDLKRTTYDWNAQRYYNELLFDNDYGKFTFEAVVQYNKLQSIKPTFIPIQQIKTVYRKETWIPFISASYNTLNYYEFGGGIFYHSLGFSMNYVTDFNRKGIGIGLLYKF